MPKVNKLICALPKKGHCLLRLGNKYKKHLKGQS